MIYICNIIIIMFALSVQAQDNHYWYQQYGARSTGLSGAVIAGIRDNSAIYYNPGAMSFIDENSVSADATVYSMSFLKIKNGLGTGNDLSSSPVMIYPQAISGILQLKKIPRLKIGYGLLTRNKSNLSINERVEMDIDILKNINGTERYVGAFEYNATLDEEWAGFGLSWKFSEKFAAGFSNFASIRIHSTRNFLYIRAFPKNNYAITMEGDTLPFYTASISNYEDIKYTNVNQLFKFGFAYNSKFLNLGATIISPGIRFNMVDLGKVQREATRSNISSDSQGEYISRPDYIAIDRQDKLPVYYKSPWSIGAGLEIRYNNNSLFASVEYFSKIDQYFLIKADIREDYGMPPGVMDNVNEQTGGEFLTVSRAAASVTNFAIGYEYRISPAFAVQCGFRTDYNHQKNADYKKYVYLPRLAGSYWDLYHLSLGAFVKKDRHFLSLALNFTYYYESDTWQIINLSEPYEYNTNTREELRGDRKQDAELSFRGYAVIVGYTRIIKD
ncbi:MAG: hypothetical protein HY738_09415 [Bacteroidia bacterium]|nr:hypothetical protein [Bacteroidia bacterium]